MTWPDSDITPPNKFSLAPKLTAPSFSGFFSGHLWESDMPLFVYMFSVYLFTLEDPVGLRDLNLTHGRSLIGTLSEPEHGYTTVHAKQPLKSPVEEFRDTSYLEREGLHSSLCKLWGGCSSLCSLQRGAQQWLSSGPLGQRVL